MRLRVVGFPGKLPRKKARLVKRLRALLCDPVGDSYAPGRGGEKRGETIKGFSQHPAGRRLSVGEAGHQRGAVA